MSSITIDALAPARVIARPASARSVSARGITREAAKAVEAQAWATTLAFTVVYGVAFAFAFGPAMAMVSPERSAAATLTSHAALVLIALLAVSINSVVLGLGLSRSIDTRFGAGSTRSQIELAAVGVLVAVLAAGLYAGIAVAAFGAVTSGIVWSAVVGVLVPGVLAAATARHCAINIASGRREMAGAAVGAVMVVVLVVYLLDQVVGLITEGGMLGL